MLYNIPNALGEHDTRVVVIYTVIPILSQDWHFQRSNIVFIRTCVSWVRLFTLEPKSS